MEKGNEQFPLPGLWGTGPSENLDKYSDERLHRSDMLLEKQMIVARKVIQSLNHVVEKLERSPELKKSFLQQIALLSRKSQHLKLVLEVLNKINLEIHYFRRKLHESIKGHQEKSELIRQRIQWLEKRLETIVVNNSEEKMSKIFQEPSLAHSLPEIKAPKSILHGDLRFSRPLFPSRKAVVLAHGDAKEAGKEKNVIEDLDESDKYWLFGHHRFSYTPNMGQLLKENPLSYHSIGLAVPASYVDKDVLSGERGSSIPWLEEQDPMKGNFDIMREDLELIQKKIYRIHTKMYNAANLSVNVLDPDSSPVPKPQSDDSVRRIYMTPLMSHTPATSHSGRHLFQAHPRSLTGGSLAQLSDFSENEGTATYSSDVHRSPPLHHQQAILPLTRTNVSKKYPYSCGRWSNAEPNKNGLAIQPTIANQRDLKNKTKLRLFIPRRMKQRKSATRDLITPSSVTSNRSYRKATNAVRFIENLKSSDGTALSSIQKDRLHELWNTVVSSPRVDDRVYAARSLASLGSTATEDSVAVLTKALNDSSPAVKFEVAKALVQLGEWHELAIKELTEQLRNGNHEVRSDVLEQLACSDQVKFVHLQIEEKPQLQKLIEVLRLLATNREHDDEISFQASVCLGEICGTYDDTSANIATSKLLQVIQSTDKWDWHSQGLEVLVRQLNYFDEATLKAIITQLKNARKWQDRLSAALLVAYVGPSQMFRLMEEKDAFDIFFPKLWDDAKREVRLGVSQAFTSLGLRNRLLEELGNQINSNNAEIRSRAVMAISAVGLRSDKTLRSLVEMLGLDSSNYVRLQIMRTFHALGITDIRVVRALREREKGGGPLAREASKILASMDVRVTTGVSSVAGLQHSKHSERQMTTADGTMTGLSWFSSPPGRSRDNVATRDSKRYSRNEATSCSRQSSDMFSTPQYEIISTAVQNSRSSPNAVGFRLPTGESYTSVSSFY